MFETGNLSASSVAFHTRKNFLLYVLERKVKCF